MSSSGRSGRIGPGIGIRAFLIALTMLGAMPWLAPSAPHAEEPGGRAVVVLEVDGIIGPAMADYVIRGLALARERQAPAVMLRIDTPGGLDTSMRAVIRAILASPVPVLAYVSPSGARAASAGTYILYASHVAAMAPGTNLGAATPVPLGGGQPARAPDDGRPADRDPAAGKEPAAGKDLPASRRAPASASEAKAMNDAVAYIRSLAELRGRNADWAELAVRDAASLSANTALEQKVVDIVAADAEDLLKQAHGREVRTGDATASLQTTGLPLAHFQPDWKTRVLGVITNPNVALILMMVGIYGLLFELMSPGALFPGTLGAICLLLGLYGLATLPLNYTGAGLAILGMVLLVGEAFLPSFGVLGIGGAVAFTFGVAILMDTDGLPGFAIYRPLIGGLALAGIGLALLVGRLAMRSFKQEVRTGLEAMRGAHAEVTDWAGLAGHVFVHGERWNAVASHPLQAGQRVQVVAVDGLTLGVAAADGHRSGDTES